MTRNIRDAAKQTSGTSHLSRRTVLGLMGSAAAASLLGGEPLASAEQPKAQTQNANGRIVRIEARPEMIAINTAKTAIIVVDMQNDFGAKGGMFDLAGIDISGIRKAIGPHFASNRIEPRVGY